MASRRISRLPDVVQTTITQRREMREAWRGRYFVAFPDLSDECRRAINAASAMPAWVAINASLARQARSARKAADRHNALNGILDVGYRHLGRDDGMDAATVRRQVKALAKIGLVTAVTQGIVHVIDPATGRIKAKQHGRVPAVRITVHVLPEHLRPAKRNGAPAPRTYVPSKGAGATHPVTPASIPRHAVEKTPTDLQEKAGGHSAAKASQEKGRHQEPVRTATPPGEATPHAGRERQASASSSGEESRLVGNAGRQDGHAAIVTPGREPDRLPCLENALDTGGPAEPPESSQEASERPYQPNYGWKAKQAAYEARKASQPAMPGFSAAAELRRLKRLAAGLPEEEDTAAPPAAVPDADLAIVQAAIDAKTAERRANQAADREHHRQAYHREKTGRPPQDHSDEGRRQAALRQLAAAGA